MNTRCSSMIAAVLFAAWGLLVSGVDDAVALVMDGDTVPGVVDQNMAPHRFLGELFLQGKLVFPLSTGPPDRSQGRQQETEQQPAYPGDLGPPGSHILRVSQADSEGEGQVGTPYDVKDVPHVMYFNYDAEALHGAYWHSNFGTPMSHGCVNLPLDMATFLFDWAPLGTMVWVHA